VTAVREVVKPVLKPREVVKEEVVEVPMALHYVRRVAKNTSEEVIDVPMQVPEYVAVPKVEILETKREVTVPHVHRTERVVVTPREQIVERPVEVPQTHTVRNIRYVPKFYVEPPRGGSESVGSHTDLGIRRLAEV